MAETVERRLSAILSADVVGYTRLMRADEEGTLARFRAHRTELVEPKIAEYKGRIVKLMGGRLARRVRECRQCRAMCYRGSARDARAQWRRARG